MKKFDFWSWLTLLLVTIMVIVMLIPGSFFHTISVDQPEPMYDFTSYIAKGQAGIWGVIGFGNGVAILLVSIAGALRKEKGFVLHWIVTSAYLYWAYLCVLRDTGRWLPFVPPMLAAASMVTAFVAWLKDRKEAE